MVLISGIIAGAVATTLSYPLDVTRTHVTIKTKSSRLGVWETLIQVMTENGMRGIFKGWTPSLLGISPYVAVKLTMFDYLKRLNIIDRSNTTLYYLVLGTISGSVATLVSYPFQVIRRNIQIRTSKSPYCSSFELLCYILKTDGMFGLYRGFIP